VQSEAEPRWLLEKRVSEENDFSDNAARFYSDGKTTIIAEVGDVMPDGGTLAKVGTAGQDIAMNNAGDVVFDGMLTDGTSDLPLAPWTAFAGREDRNSSEGDMPFGGCKQQYQVRSSHS